MELMLLAPTVIFLEINSMKPLIGMNITEPIFSFRKKIVLRMDYLNLKRRDKKNYKNVGALIMMNNSWNIWKIYIRVL